MNDYNDMGSYQQRNSQTIRSSMQGSNPYSYRPTSSSQRERVYRPAITKQNPMYSDPYKIYKLNSQQLNLHGRPPTPVYLTEQAREELYDNQLKKSISNKLNMQHKNRPMFPMMDDQISLASETLGRPGSNRPGSYRPGSASNPDFMLPKDVQYYYKNKEKVFKNLEDFYEEEKKSIEEMMNECLKNIITIFEEHKQDLYKRLSDDKTTFGKIYVRFSEGVELFLKSTETRLETNLKGYEERIMKIQEDDENPLGTHIEKLRLEKEMINSKERIIHEVKQSYENSSIPWDKQKIGELMVDQYKKKHSVNVSGLAQHMQKVLEYIRQSIQTFDTFKTYSNLEIIKDNSKSKSNGRDPTNLTPDMGKVISPSQREKYQMAIQGIKNNAHQNITPFSNEMMNINLQNNQIYDVNNQQANMIKMGMGASGISQQMMMGNMSFNPNFMNSPQDMIQMAMLQKQMGIRNEFIDQILESANQNPNIYSNMASNLPSNMNPKMNSSVNSNMKHNMNPEIPTSNLEIPNPNPNSNPNSNSTYIQKNFEGPVFRPHINGDFNFNINALENQQKKWSPKPPNSYQLTNPKIPKSLPELEKLHQISNSLQPNIKSPDQKHQDIAQERSVLPDKNFENKKSVTFNLPDSGIEEPVGHHNEALLEQPISSNNNNFEMSKRVKQNNFDEQELNKRDMDEQERAKSPILRAKESIQHLNNLYDSSKQVLGSYRPNLMGIYKQSEPETIKQSEPVSAFKNLRDKKFIRKDLLESTQDRQIRPGSHQPVHRGYDGSHIRLNSNKLKGSTFSRDLLKPKDRKTNTSRHGLEMDIDRLSQKYGRGPIRPASHKVNTLHSTKLLSKLSI